MECKIMVKSDILKCHFFVHNSKICVSCHRGGKKPETLHIQEAEIKDLGLFLLKAIIVMAEAQHIFLSMDKSEG